jgi:hypothetical protein
VQALSRLWRVCGSFLALGPRPRCYVVTQFLSAASFQAHNKAEYEGFCQPLDAGAKIDPSKSLYVSSQYICESLLQTHHGVQQDFQDLEIRDKPKPRP